LIFGFGFGFGFYSQMIFLSQKHHDYHNWNTKLQKIYYTLCINIIFEQMVGNMLNIQMERTNLLIVLFLALTLQRFEAKAKNKTINRFVLSICMRGKLTYQTVWEEA
jgi:hypothetical protein